MTTAAAEYLAIDLGASSGRAVVGSLDGRGRLALREVHRFANGPVELPTGLHWDTPRLLEEVKRGMGLARGEAGGGGAGAAAAAGLEGIGIDTWGVDYGLLSASGELLGLPHHYRDPRTRGMVEEAFRIVGGPDGPGEGKRRIYGRTGIQFMALNTLCQLMAEARCGDGRLGLARRLLFTPDLLGYWLTGEMRSERTIASTSQLLDPGSGEWAVEIAGALGIPGAILPEVAEPGTELGRLLPGIATETGLGPVPVISPGSHDTASAVAAVPAEGEGGGDWAYISCGTWSLVGRELGEPIRSAAAMEAGFTNECGVAGTIRFHRNVAGLWLLQECQRVWAARGMVHEIGPLLAAAAAAPAMAALVDPDDASFAEFGDMPARIRAYCERSGQRPPETEGAIARCVLESLALKYRAAIDSLEAVSGGRVSRVHMVGGGVKNEILCQWTADATGREVLAGPVEATAAGNVLVQAMGRGRVGSLAEIREIVARSFVPVKYEPRAGAGREEGLARLTGLGG